jgi:voltage-gated potassium channel
MKRISNFLEWHLKDRYYYLFIALALFLLLPPFLMHFKYLSHTIHILLSSVIVNCVFILFDRSDRAGYGVLVLFVSLVFIWLSVAREWQIKILEVAKMVILVLFFGFTFAKMVGEIFKLKRVTGRVVIGAIGAYLLLGLIGAILFEIIDLIYVDSFTQMTMFTDFYGKIYYSFVTISTLGYGDITPVTSQGQAVAILVAISGQLYLAILMAMLVGKFLKESDK